MELGKRVKIAYGIIGIADQCQYFLFGTFFLFFATTVAGLDAAVAGAMAAMGAVWDAVSSAFIGNLSDRCSSPHGRRRIFIMAASLPAAITTSLLFTSFDLGSSAKVAYYVIMTLFFWSSFSGFFIPYLAWGAELTQDYDQRTVLRGYAYAGNTVGMAIGAVIPSVVVEATVGAGLSTAAAWQFTASLIGIILFLVLFFGAWSIKPDGKTPELTISRSQEMNVPKRKGMKGHRFGSSPEGNLISQYLSLLKIPALRYAIYASILYLAANTIFVADRLYFYTYNMGLTGGQISLLMGLEPFVGLIFMPIITAVSKHFDKRSQYIAGLLICGFSMLVLRFTGTRTFFEAAIMLVFFGIGAICYWQFMPSMIYDVCEADELETGLKRQGKIVSLQAMSESFSEAIGLFLLGYVLKLAGFDGAAAVQQETALTWVSNCFTFIPGLFMMASAYMIYKYPITREVYENICRKLQQRRSEEAQGELKQKG